MKKLDHIGIAVTSLDQSLLFFRDVLGLELLSIEEVESEGVKVAFLKSGETKIELLEPIKEGAIASFIEKKGQGIHHLAFSVENILDEIDYLKENGVKMIQNIPKRGAGGKQIVFMHPKSTEKVLIELCQKGE
ncbi:MAG: methylmalonyl-CoA epimerase [Bacillaceae bacterium]